MCRNTDIKEMLPAYLEQGLDEEWTSRVEKHLETCAECRTEIKLLRMMAAEPVPDPGEAFWAAMPVRIYRDVQKMKVKQRRFEVSRLWDGLLLPRWIWGIATAGIVLVISLLIITPSPKEVSKITPSGDESDYEESTIMDTPGLTELSQTELENVSVWADSELSSLSSEIVDVLTSAPERDIHEELSELNHQEIERLSKKLEEWEQEA
jgi:hypothetical protein